MQDRNLPIAVFASGGGRSVENLARLIEDGTLAASIRLVLTDRSGIGVLERAERLGLPHCTLAYSREGGAAEFSEKAFAAADEHACELVVLAGFLRLLHLPERWLGKVINIHPALLPAFGGKGYYGDRVHAAVLERGVQFTGCTVHLVDNEYDHGKILLQRCIRVNPNDDVASLAARVFEEEQIALPEAIRMFVRGEVVV